MKRSLFFITRSAVIAAIYFALSVAMQPIAFGPIQFRLSEALVLLPALMPAAIPGLAVGCLFTNYFFSPFGIYDMLFGTLATLLGAAATYLMRRHIALSALPPIVFNALLVPLIWIADGSDTLYYVNMFSILISEFIICGVIGVPFTLMLKKALTAAGMLSPMSKYPKAPAYRRIESAHEDDGQDID